MKKKMLLLGLSMATLTLAGCNSSGSGGDQTTSPTSTTVTKDATTGVAYAGSSKCISCHKDFTWSSAIVSKYLSGKHVNHSTHVDAAMGPAGTNCLECHDPIGDGPGLQADLATFDSANNVVTPIPAAGLAAVGCENCHGAGGQHYGVGGIPTPNPDYTSCGNGKCHNSRMPHPTYHPEGVNVIEDYTLSRHKDGEVRNSAICVRCHSDEGARLYKNTKPFNGMTTAILTAELQPVATASSVQCRTCHDAHQPDTLLFAATSTASSEFLTCTFCHQSPSAVLGDDPAPGTTTDGPTGGSTGLLYHAKRYSRVIASTHYDNPATSYTSAAKATTDPAYAANVIEGYVVNPKSERACRDCHNVHSGDIAINEQWAKSAHGGKILTLKKAAAASQTNSTFAQVQAVRAAGAAAATSPNAHYDWDAADRQSCQRCHTATGAVNFMTSQTTYDQTKNDFSNLSGWKAAKAATATTAATPVVSSGQNEMIYCWACHTDNQGALRTPGPITAPYTNAPHTFPDAKGSNVCMACHTGRESGESIKNLAASTDFSNKSFVNSHYLTAGATVFTASGYEYDTDANPATDNYANPSYYAHDKIGMGTDSRLTAFETANPKSGANGPCVGCHMTASESHLYEPVEKDSADTITAVTATVCINCHDGSHGTALVAKGGDATKVAAAATFLETEKEDFEAALETLSAQMIKKGFFFYPNNPYIFKSSGLDPAASTFSAQANKNWGDATTGKPNMGAAFNFNLLKHEGGAFVHNRIYAKRLIFDSIDWLDDGVLNSSTGATIDALVGSISYPEVTGSAPVAATTLSQAQADVAKSYLDGDAASAGVQRP